MGSLTLAAAVACVTACGSDGSSGGGTDTPDAGSSGSLGSDSGTGSPDSGASEFVIGGTVSGLAGAGLTLTNGTDKITVPAGATTFTFPTKIARGAAYAALVGAQPTVPNQVCTVTGGTGTATADVTSIKVACATSTYPISVNVTGAAGMGLVLEDNGGDDLAVSPMTGTQKVTFKTPVASGKSFAITIKTQPANPTQLCVVAGGTGTVVAGEVATVTVNCTTAYTVGGTITNLSGVGLILRNNGGDDLPVNMNGTFAFATPVIDGSPYAITVKTGPTAPWQTCTVTGDSGNVAGAPITSVAVDCATNSYTLGGNVTGLSGTGLVLHNGAEDYPISGNGPFTFVTPVLSGTTFKVTTTDPTTPWQTCTVTGGSDTMKGANVTNVAVACVTNSYNVGGTVSGLTGKGLVLSVNGTNLGAINANGAFSTKLASGTAYTWTVATQPTGQTTTCSIGNPTGTVAGADVTNVNVVCAKILLVEASPYASDVQTNLTAAGFTTDLFNAGAATPTLAALQQYYGVLVFSDQGFNDAVALGNVLADYFDAGGVVVMSTFANASVPVQGRWSTGNYHLINPTGQTEPNDQGALTILVPASPLVGGVKTLTAISSYQSTGGVINGGVAVANWGAGGVLIVSGVKNGQKYAAINMYPPSSAIRSDFWIGDGTAIMANALLYH